MRFVAALVLAGAATGQELEISVSPTPIGSGARAAGMADAFVAIADDATAASWNPAGLVQLEEPEFSIVGAYNSVSDRFDAPYHPEFRSDHHSDNLDLNFLSIVYPLPVGLLPRNATVALSYQHKFDFTRNFDFNLNRGIGGTPPLNLMTKFQFDQQGSLGVISPAFAIEVTHRLSVGATLNLWRSTPLSENSWEQTIRSDTTSLMGTSLGYSNFESYERYKNFKGENWILGALWNPTERWSVGVRYDSMFTGDADYESQTRGFQLTLPSPFTSGGLNLRFPTSAKGTRSVRFPDSLALGVAHRFNDRTTVSMDITRTDWNDFQVHTEQRGIRSLVDFSDRKNPWTRTDFDATYTVRLGWEHIFLPKEPALDLKTLWTLRGGLFLDQEPATNKSAGFRWPGDNGDGRPDNFYGVTAGLGIQLVRRVNLDFAYQARFGDGVNRDFIRGLNGFEEDVVQHRFISSAVVYF